MNKFIKGGYVMNGTSKIKPYACIFQKASFQTLAVAAENIIFFKIFYPQNDITN